MPQLFSNNGSALLAQDLLAGDLLAVVGANFGSRFPFTSEPTDFFIAVLDDGVGNLEVVKCVLRNGDSMVLERAQEGTLAQDFPQGSRIGCRISAGTMAGFMEPDQALFMGTADLNSNALINGEVLGVPIRGESGDASNELVVPPLDARPTIGGVDILLVTDNPLVKGMIFMWSGDPLSLPANWNLCDGTNGTPDLKSRFVVSYDATPGPFDTIHNTGGNATDTDPAGAHAHGGTAVATLLTEDDVPTLTLNTNMLTSTSSSDDHTNTNSLAPGTSNENIPATTPVDYKNASPTEHDHVLNGELDHTHPMIPAYYTLAYIQFEGVEIAPVFSGNLADESYLTNEVITPVDTTLQFNEGNGTSPTYGATGLPTGLSIVPTGVGRGVISGTVDAAADAGSPYAVQVTLTTSIAPPAVSNIATWDVALPVTLLAVLTPINYVDPCEIRVYLGDFEVSWDGGLTFTPYAAGNPKIVSEIPTNTGTGQIILRGTDPATNRLQFLSDTYDAIDVQKASTLLQADSMCSNLSLLTSFSMVDNAGIGSYTNFLANCVALASFSISTLGTATDVSGAWLNCSSLTSFPLLDTSLITNFTNCWNGCAGLLAFPQLDVSSGTSFSSAWRGCASLTSFPPINTSNGTNFGSTFWGCSSLICLSSVDTTSASAATSMFFDTPALVAPTAGEQTSIETVPPGLAYVNAGACP